MIELPNIKKIKHQSYNLSNPDGVTELNIGIFHLVIALNFINAILIPFLPGLTIFTIIIGSLFSDLIRRKYVYHRVGYIKLKLPFTSSKTYFKIVFVILCSLMLKILLMYLIEGGFGGTTVLEVLYGRPLWKWMPIFYSSFLLGYCIDIVCRTGRRMFLWNYLFAEVVGIVLAFIPFNTTKLQDYPFFYFIVLGSFWLIRGLIHFRRFLITHPKRDIIEGENTQNG